MKKKLLFSCAPFLSLTVAAASVAILQPRGPALLASVFFLLVLSAACFLLYRFSLTRILSPIDRIGDILDHARRIGVPVERTAENQIDGLFKDVEKAFELVLRANTDLEAKVRIRREELEASESRLRRLNSFLDSIVENIPDMIFVKDARELRFVLFNKAGEEVLGYPREELIGKNDFDFFPKEEADFFTAKDRQVLNRGKTVLIDEEPIHTKTGLKILHTKKIPLLNADGVPEYLLGISEDVTAKKQSEANLNQRTRELAKAQSEKDQMELFAYVAAHDLREPAHKISSFGDLLAEFLPAEGPAREYLARMQSASERMGRLIDDLLRFSKITRGEVRNERVPLNDVLHDVVQDFELSISKFGAVVTSDPLPVVTGGRVQLQEIFRNLIGNALKFRQPDRRSEIHVSSEMEPDGSVSVSFQDNGIGFDQVYAERIFRPFERLHSRREYDGSGIGLAICQTMTEQMGARIHAKSSPGEGAVFTIVFPSSSEKPASPAPAFAGVDRRTATMERRA